MDTSKRCVVRSWARLTVIVSLGAGTVACAHTTPKDRKKQQNATKKKLKKLQSRIEELEKTNGRLTVRIDKMEDEIFLLQDRVEAHRLALKRRGAMNRRGASKEKARAPEPTPQTNYGRRQGRRRGKYEVRGSSGHSARDDSSESHPVTRIELSEQQARAKPRRRAAKSQGDNPNSNEAKRDDAESKTSDETSERERRKRAQARARAASKSGDGDGDTTEKVVITDSEFKQFAQKVDDDEPSKSKESASKSGTESSSDTSTDRGAEKTVTDERLDTRTSTTERDTNPSRRSTTSNQAADAPKAPEQGDDPFAGKSGLDLYKTALAKYRAGTYATALEGFEKFMQSGPRNDYRDNGLYWIGECKFGLGEFDEAIRYFKRVVEEQPGGNKVPDAMLKMALAYREIGETQAAKKLLNKLTEQYPSTNAGRLGQKKLSNWNS